MDIEKRARNLSVLSFAVILYILGGASFKQDGSLFGGSVTFSRVWILEYVALTLLAFYAYRFWLVARHSHKVLSQRDSYLHSSPEFQKYVTDVGKEELVRLQNSNQDIGGQFFNKGSADYPVNVSWAQQQGAGLPPSIVRKKFQRHARIRALSKGNAIKAEFQVELSWRKCISFELSALLQAIFFNDDFWEEFFPLILCTIAIALVIARNFNFL